MAIPFPFSAIVGQDEMKLAILIAAVNPSVGGVLVLGDRGTGQSTAVRSLAALRPPIRPLAEFCFGCQPAPPPGRVLDSSGHRPRPRPWGAGACAGCGLG